MDHSSAADSHSQVAHELKSILIAGVEERNTQRQNHVAITLNFKDLHSFAVCFFTSLDDLALTVNQCPP